MDSTASESDLAFMREALLEAELAQDHADVPVGCLIVDSNGRELARDHNRREQRSDPTAHAEILAVRTAAAKLGHWRLQGASVFVTLEPCPMCAGALVNARIARLVYGASDSKAGAVRSLLTLGDDPRFNHRFEIVPGVLAEASVLKLQAFFVKLRAQREK